MAGFSYTATTRPLSSPGVVRTNEQWVSPNAWPTRRTRVWKISSARRAAETSWKMSNSRSRQRVARLVELAPHAQVGLDARPQLAEVHGARERVARAGLERVGHRLRAPLAHQHDHGDAGEPRPFGTRREEHEIGRLRVRPVEAGRRVGRLGHLEAGADQEA